MNRFDEERKQRAIFAYKSSSRFLLTLLTVEVIFLLAFSKARINPRYDFANKSYDVASLAKGLERGLNGIWEPDSIWKIRVFGISSWNRERDTVLPRDILDPGGALYKLVEPGQSTVSLNELFSNLRNVLSPIGAGEVKQVDITNISKIYPALFGNSADSAILSSFFADEQIKRGFTEINLRRHWPNAIERLEKWKQNEKQIAFAMVTEYWNGNKYLLAEGIDTSGLSLVKLEQLTNLGKQDGLPFEPIDVAAGLKATGPTVFYFLPMVVIALLFLSRWFYARGKKVGASVNPHHRPLTLRNSVVETSSALLFFMKESHSSRLLNVIVKVTSFTMLVLIPVIACVIVPVDMPSIIQTDSTWLNILWYGYFATCGVICSVQGWTFWRAISK